MGKKSRLKAERAHIASLTPEQPPVPAWAGKVVVVLGVGYILTSILQIGAFADYGRYAKLFQDSSAAYIPFRYFMSWIARLLGLTFGIGFLFRKELFRKALIALATGTIAVVYWKHPFAAFVQNLKIGSAEMSAQGVPFSPESIIRYLQAWNISWATETFFAQLVMTVVIVLDVLVALIVLYLLTRPAVKALCR